MQHLQETPFITKHTYRSTDQLQKVEEYVVFKLSQKESRSSHNIGFKSKAETKNIIV
jgi:ribulose kinase